MWGSKMVKPKADMYCMCCKKETPHTPYCEEREFNYRDILVSYTENGWICNVCGEEQQTAQQFDEAMAEIRETYYIMKK